MPHTHLMQHEDTAESSKRPSRPSLPRDWHGHDSHLLHASWLVLPSDTIPPNWLISSCHHPHFPSHKASHYPLTRHPSLHTTTSQFSRGNFFILWTLLSRLKVFDGLIWMHLTGVFISHCRCLYHLLQVLLVPEQGVVKHHVPDHQSKLALVPRQTTA